MSVSIVTPWMNHLELADDYFRALELAGMDYELVIVDNGSAPPLPFATVRSEANLGFNGGCNAGLHAATGDVVLYLNNDIIGHREGWLRDIVQDTEPGVLTGARLVNPEHAMVDGVSMPYLDGWCLAGMRDDLLELGGWDEDLEEPSYYGDNILCLRARSEGFLLREVSTGLIHKGGMTSQANGFLLPSTIANKRVYEELARELLAEV